jgi:hypothetical protein
VARRSAAAEPEGGTPGGFHMSPVALRSGYLWHEIAFGAERDLG